MITSREWIKIEQWVRMVKEFHQVFNAPIGNGKIPLTGEWKKRRIKWLTEELREYCEAIYIDNLIAKIDALGDLIYFCVGWLVEIGVTPTLDNAIEFPKQEIKNVIAELIINLDFIGHDAQAQINFVLSIIYRCALGIPPIAINEVFIAIHKANMRKLWADGKPRWDEDGKVIKPPGWIGPEKEIGEILEAHGIKSYPQI